MSCAGALRARTQDHRIPITRYAAPTVRQTQVARRGTARRASCRLISAGVQARTRPGLIDWKQYLRNRATLESNRAAFLGSDRRIPAPREGAALLQSRVICGRCGRRMGMQYNRAPRHRNRPARYFYVCGEQRDRYGRKTCQCMRGDLVDAAVARFVIEALNRKNIDLALAVQAQVKVEFAEADAQRERRIEGIRYEADLARRRFYEVDPANRLVAATLEAEWNERLRDLDEACRERDERAGLHAELSCGERIGMAGTSAGVGTSQQRASRPQAAARASDGRCDADPGRLGGDHQSAHAGGTFGDA